MGSYCWITHNSYSDFSTLRCSNDMMDMFFDIIILLYNLYNHVSYLFPRSRVITDFTTHISPRITGGISTKKTNTPRITMACASNEDGLFGSLGLVILVLTGILGRGTTQFINTPKEATNKKHAFKTACPGPPFFQEVSQNWCGRLYAFFQQRCWAYRNSTGSEEWGKRGVTWDLVDREVKLNWRYQQGIHMSCISDRYLGQRWILTCSNDRGGSFARIFDRYRSYIDAIATSFVLFTYTLETIPAKDFVECTYTANKKWMTECQHISPLNSEEVLSFVSGSTLRQSNRQHKKIHH